MSNKIPNRKPNFLKKLLDQLPTPGAVVVGKIEAGENLTIDTDGAVVVTEATVGDDVYIRAQNLVMKELTAGGDITITGKRKDAKR